MYDPETIGGLIVFFALAAGFISLPWVIDKRRRPVDREKIRRSVLSWVRAWEETWKS